jgi:hypothetical protein
MTILAMRCDSPEIKNETNHPKGLNSFSSYLDRDMKIVTIKRWAFFQLAWSL